MILFVVFFTLLKISYGLEYEVTRLRLELDRIVFKTHKTDICATYRATYLQKTDNTVTCSCPLGTTFHSINSEMPACHPSNAVQLGCSCSGTNCASSITPNLSMVRRLHSGTTWCNNETTPSYTIQVWTPAGWKAFSRPDDMAIILYVENGVRKLKFQWKVDGFNVISHYSGNLFLITMTCNKGQIQQCFFAKSPGTKEYNVMKPSNGTVKPTLFTLPKQSFRKEVERKSSTIVLIVTIFGVLLLIIILVIVATLIHRRISSDKEAQESSSDRLRQIAVTQADVVLSPRAIPPPRKREQDPTYYIIPNNLSADNMPALLSSTDIISSQNANNQYAHVYLTAARPVPPPRTREQDPTYYITPNNLSADNMPALLSSTDIISSQNANSHYAHVYLTAARPVPPPRTREQDPTYYIIPNNLSADNMPALPSSTDIISSQNANNQYAHVYLTAARPVPPPRTREQDPTYYITPNTISGGDMPALSNPTDVISFQNADNQYAYVYLTSAGPTTPQMTTEEDSTQYITPITTSDDENDIYSVIPN